MSSFIKLQDRWPLLCSAHFKCVCLRLAKLAFFVFFLSSYFYVATRGTERMVKCLIAAVKMLILFGKSGKCWTVRGEGVIQGLNKQVNICHPVSEAGVYVKKGAMSSTTTVLSQGTVKRSHSVCCVWLMVPMFNVANTKFWDESQWGLFSCDAKTNRVVWTSTRIDEPVRLNMPSLRRVCTYARVWRINLLSGDS